MSSLRIIIARELRAYLFAKSTIISLIIITLIPLAIGIGIRTFNSSGAFDSDSTLAVTPQTKVFVPTLNATQKQLGSSPYDVVEKATSEEARAAVKADDATYALVEAENGKGLTLVAKERLSQVEELMFQGATQSIALSDYLVTVGGSLEGFAKHAAEFGVTTEILDTSSNDDLDAGEFTAAYGLVLILFMITLTGPMTVANSVVEEKSSRVVELIVACVKPSTLIAGKVIGTAIGTLVYFAFPIASSYLGAKISGFFPEMPVTLGPTLVWSLAFAIVGYFIAAFMAAALGALASRAEDLQYAIAPFTIVMVCIFYAALFIMFFAPRSTGALIAAYIPLASTVIAPVALITGTMAWWQALISFVLACVACVLLVHLAGRIYRASILNFGARMSLRQALR